MHRQNSLEKHRKSQKVDTIPFAFSKVFVYNECIDDDATYPHFETGDKTMLNVETGTKLGTFFNGSKEYELWKCQGSFVMIGRRFEPTHAKCRGYFEIPDALNSNGWLGRPTAKLVQLAVEFLKTSPFANLLK